MFDAHRVLAKSAFCTPDPRQEQIQHFISEIKKRQRGCDDAMRSCHKSYEEGNTAAAITSNSLASEALVKLLQVESSARRFLDEETNRSEHE